MLLSIGMPLSFSTWQALINNFAIEQAGYSGIEFGIMQSLREIPGFLSFAVIFLLVFIREQSLALVFLCLLGVGTALTGFFPSIIGLYLTTVLMSIGFHYFETLRQSLVLQWTDKDETAHVLGKLIAVGSFASLVAFGLIYIGLDLTGLEMRWVYLIGGGLTVVVAGIVWAAFPRFPSKVKQLKRLVLRRRYWLYYLLVFMSGARRQIFVVFAGFLMVEKFGFQASTITLLFMANCVINIFLAPLIGKLIGRWGERRALTIEYIGLIGVFTAYAFVDVAWLAAVLYIVDHMFFAMAIAIKTYFQKIADPADIASSAGVSLTISHIAAVVIPAAFGFLWMISPPAVFLLGAAMAGVSLGLARLVPDAPSPGNASLIGRVKASAGAAE
ncbi:MAG: MFS transporter [Proteobacteria bacterium]|nr:MFS transporter [Pseudomonadota bacterium]